MISETIQPIIKELPIKEKRRLLEWLKGEVEDKPLKKPVNINLRNKLIKHIEKTKNKNIS